METFEGHRNFVTNMAFAADGRIATGSADQTIRRSQHRPRSRSRSRAKLLSELAWLDSLQAACRSFGPRQEISTGCVQSAAGLQEPTMDLGGTQVADAVAEELRGSMTAAADTSASARLAACVAACVAACRAPVLPARPDDAKQRPVPGHEHCLWVSGGITWCQVCGAYGEARLRGLLRACPGPLRGRGGRATTLQRLRAGRHPLTMEPLPRAKPLR